MSQMQIDQVLAQIRSLSTLTKPPGAAGVVAPTGNSDFATLMKSGLDQVNQTEQRATDMATAFQRGDQGVELPQVMIEMQKAAVSLRAVTEVRNRLISAYQDIMNMQL